MAVTAGEAHSFGGALMFLTRMLEGNDLNGDQKKELLRSIRKAAQQFRDGETKQAAETMQALASDCMGHVAMKTKKDVMAVFGE